MRVVFQRPQLILTTGFLTGFVFVAVQMCIPLYAKERLGVGGMMLGVYGLSFNLLLVFLALAADRIRRGIGFRGAMALGGAVLAAASFLVPWVRRPLWVIAPCLLWGVAHALYVPAVLGANAEGQTPEQIKRGAVWSMIWAILGQTAGSAVAGRLYEIRPMAPFLACGALATVAALLTLPRQAMKIAPWRAGAPHRDHAVSLGRKRTFVRLAFLANFGLCVSVLTVMVLLPEHAQTASLTGLKYGALFSILMLGALTSHVSLALWHGWHYSARFLIGVQAAAAAALIWFSCAESYSQLCASQYVIGYALGLTYLSSVYYGMELGGWNTGHGGRHEAVVGAAMGLGPFLGGAVIALSGHPRAPFLAAAGLIFLLILMQVRLLPRPSRDEGGNKY